MGREMALTELYFVWVVTSLVCGIVGYVIAKRSGYNRLLGASLGIILNIVAVGLLYSLDKHRGRE